MASFVLSFFTLDVLDEIWDLIESVSEGFLTYSFLFSDHFTNGQNTLDKSKIKPHFITQSGSRLSMCSKTLIFS